MPWFLKGTLPRLLVDLELQLEVFVMSLPTYTRR